MNRLIGSLKGIEMLSWVITFIVLALIAGLFGFTSIAGASFGFAKILFVVFLVLLVLSFLRGRKLSV